MEEIHFIKSAGPQIARLDNIQVLTPFVLSFLRNFFQTSWLSSTHVQFILVTYLAENGFLASLICPRHSFWVLKRSRLSFWISNHLVFMRKTFLAKRGSFDAISKLAILKPSLLSILGTLLPKSHWQNWKWFKHDPKLHIVWRKLHIVWRKPTWAENDPKGRLKVASRQQICVGVAPGTNREPFEKANVPLELCVLKTSTMYRLSFGTFFGPNWLFWNNH